LDQELLVKDRFDEGLRFISQLVRDGFTITVAFWVKTSEEGLWFLYIASPSVNSERIGDAYRAVYASLRQVPDSGIALSDIKLISADNPIAADVQKIQTRYSGRTVIPFGGARLGGLDIETALIYPRWQFTTGKKTRIVGRRADYSCEPPRIVEEEIGVVEGILGEDAFNKAYLELIISKFGDFHGFASSYPLGGYFQFVE